MVENVLHGPCDQLGAECNPVRNFGEVGRTLVLAKFDGLVAVVSHWINLAVSRTDSSFYIGGVVAVGEVVRTEAARPLAVGATGWGHEAVNEAFKHLIVLVDVDDLLSAELVDAYMDVETARAIDLCIRVVKGLDAVLKRSMPGLVVVEDRGDALDAVVASAFLNIVVDGAIGDELVVAPIVPVVVSFVLDRETIQSGFLVDTMAWDYALDLDTKGEGDLLRDGLLGGLEESGEFEDVDVDRGETNFEAGFFLGLDAHVGGLDVFEVFAKGLHGSNNFKG